MPPLRNLGRLLLSRAALPGQDRQAVESTSPAPISTVTAIDWTADGFNTTRRVIQAKSGPLATKPATSLANRWMEPQSTIIQNDGHIPPALPQVCGAEGRERRPLWSLRAPLSMNRQKSESRNILQQSCLEGMVFFDHFRLWFMGSMRENSFSGNSLSVSPQGVTAAQFGSI